MRGSLALLAALLPLAGCAAPSLRVMTYNVRYASDTPPHSWPERRPAAVAMLHDARPDLIGTQELLLRQGADLVAALPGYRWFGRDRHGEHRDEHMGVFYRTNRLRLVEQGDFWLSDTPDRPGSESWGVDLPRMATWGVFAMRQSGRRFLFLNTHLAHRGQDGEARARSARLILSRLEALARGMPVIVAGDFNDDPDSDTYRVLATRLRDAWAVAPKRGGPAETFHNFTGQPTKRIDFLFIDDFRVRHAATRTDRLNGEYPSDHFPVEATLTFAR